MGKKLYVGNLPFDITEEDLRNVLSQHGPVNDIAVVMDKMTGRARGFAFATMNTEEAAKAAILALNGKDWKGRALTVNEARPREERSGGGGYGGGGPRYLKKTLPVGDVSGTRGFFPRAGVFPREAL